MKKSVIASALVLSLATASFVRPALAASSCFTPEEAQAAHFRVMQQEFNVAALNCRTVNPEDPTFDTRYNAFVGKYGAALQSNAQTLRQHFKRAGGNLDIWMTRVANEAGHRVIVDPVFCQEAWEFLDKALTGEPEQVHALATSLPAAHASVPECGEVTKSAKKHEGKPTKKVAKAKVTKAKATKAAEAPAVKEQ